MLPWIVAVLVLLNVGLFFWGFQHEKSQEPPPTPVPEGKYEIRLIGEEREQADQDDNMVVQDSQRDGEAEDEPVTGRPSEDAEADRPLEADKPARLDEAAIGMTSAAATDGPEEETEQDGVVSEPESGEMVEQEPAPEAQAEEDADAVEESPGTDAESEPGVTDELSNEVSAAEGETASPDEASGETGSVDQAVPDAGEEEQVNGETSDEAASGAEDSADSAPRPGAGNADSLSADELEVDAPADVPESSAPESESPPSPPHEDRMQTESDDELEDER